MITVRYLVNDVAASVKFYSELLGFETKQQFGPAMAIMAKDGRPGGSQILCEDPSSNVIELFQPVGG